MDQPAGIIETLLGVHFAFKVHEAQEIEKAKQEAERELKKIRRSPRRR